MKLKTIKKALSREQFKTYSAATVHLVGAREKLQKIDLRRYRGDDEVREALKEARAAVEAAHLLMMHRMYWS